MNDMTNKELVQALATDETRRYASDVAIRALACEVLRLEAMVRQGHPQWSVEDVEEGADTAKELA